MPPWRWIEFLPEHIKNPTAQILLPTLAWPVRSTRKVTAKLASHFLGKYTKPNYLDAIMKSSEVIQMLKSSINATKKQGVEYVSISDLEAYAETLQDTAEKTPEDVAAGEAALAEYQVNLSAWVASRQQLHERQLEMLRAVITIGQSALKSALLINGGAAVALLAFVGKIWGDVESKGTLEVLSIALISFVFGVLSSAMAAGATYFSQSGYSSDSGRIIKWVGDGGRVIAILFVFGGYFLFGRGAWLAYQAIVPT